MLYNEIMTGYCKNHMKQIRRRLQKFPNSPLGPRTASSSLQPQPSALLLNRCLLLCVLRAIREFTMDDLKEQRICLKFSFKLGKFHQKPINFSFRDGPNSDHAMPTATMYSVRKISQQVTLSLLCRVSQNHLTVFQIK